MKRFQLFLFDDEKEEFWATSDFFIPKKQTKRSVLSSVAKSFSDQKPLSLEKVDERWYVYNSQNKLLGYLNPL